MVYVALFIRLNFMNSVFISNIIEPCKISLFLFLDAILG